MNVDKRGTTSNETAMGEEATRRRRRDGEVEGVKSEERGCDGFGGAVVAQRSMACSHSQQ
jgi:hypothetical protein